jgi:hypothetical protein
MARNSLSRFFIGKAASELANQHPVIRSWLGCRKFMNVWLTPRKPRSVSSQTSSLNAMQIGIPNLKSLNLSHVEKRIATRSSGRDTKGMFINERNLTITDLPKD